ncbi:MAG TPA: hypothetical protein VHC98_01225 [Candidatus Saccharimonadales bacterium]|nr:hypothetical protein [Candidatus Saccharimonadales bacterium]
MSAEDIIPSAGDSYAESTGADGIGIPKKAQWLGQITMINESGADAEVVDGYFAQLITEGYFPEGASLCWDEQLGYYPVDSEGNALL